MSTHIDKPWGNEIILTPTDTPYTGKIIYLNAGKRWSLQAHSTKQETFALISGQANLITGTDPQNLETTNMIILEGYTILPNTIHRLEAITDCTVFEVSTPETGTTLRLEDDYARPDETMEIRNSPNRGWTSKS